MSKPPGKRGVTSKTSKSSATASATAAAAASAAAAAAAAAASAGGGDGDAGAGRTTPGRTASGDIDLKDDGSSNSDKKDAKATAGGGGGDEAATAPKPQSAGASIRDAAQKLLGLALRQEWTPVEQVVKNLEKAVAAAGDEANLSPLAGVMDPVSGMVDCVPGGFARLRMMIFRKWIRMCPATSVYVCRIDANLWRYACGWKQHSLC